MDYIVFVIDDAISELPSEQQSAWAEIQRGARDPLDTISRWTDEHRLAVAGALADWSRSQGDARIVLRKITAWSRKLGVLLACRVAREALRYVPAGEDRPLRAIEAAERWARREGPVEECWSAAAEARKAAITTYAAAKDAAGAADAAASAAAKDAAGAADAAASAAAYDDVDDADAAAWSAANAADAASAADAEAAAYDDVEDLNGWRRALYAELRRLCGVIAEYLLSGSSADALSALLLDGGRK
jgi:hypothetical protein